MRGDRQFEREYREWKEKEAPDLWGRIECQLKEHPEREGAKVRPGSGGFTALGWRWQRQRFLWQCCRDCPEGFGREAWIGKVLPGWRRIPGRRRKTARWCKKKTAR